jgi:hypothetical protein
MLEAPTLTWVLDSLASHLRQRWTRSATLNGYLRANSISAISVLYIATSLPSRTLTWLERRRYRVRFGFARTQLQFSLVCLRPQRLRPQSQIAKIEASVRDATSADAPRLHVHSETPPALRRCHVQFACPSSCPKSMICPNTHKSTSTTGGNYGRRGSHRAQSSI